MDGQESNKVRRKNKYAPKPGLRRAIRWGAGRATIFEGARPGTQSFQVLTRNGDLIVDCLDALHISDGLFNQIFFSLIMDDAH